MRKLLALVLAAVAGFVDVVGYLTLHHLFVAHMTGNTSKLGVALGHGDLAAAVPYAAAPFLFVAGIGVGTVLVNAGLRWAALVLQACLVATFMGYGSSVIRHGTAPGHAIWGFWVLVTLAIVALGLQTAALTEIHGSTVRTSYVSGVLTNLAQELVRRLARTGGAGGQGRPVLLLTGIWVAYIAGATAGSYGLREIGVWCLALPAGALVGAGALEVRARRTAARTRESAP